MDSSEGMDGRFVSILGGEWTVDSIDRRVMTKLDINRLYSLEI